MAPQVKSLPSCRWGSGVEKGTRGAVSTLKKLQIKISPGKRVNNGTPQGLTTTLESHLGSNFGLLLD